MIRRAEIEDFDQILTMCAEFWTHTQFSEPFERSHTLSMVKMAYDSGLLAVVDVSGNVVGFCAGIKSFLLGSTKAVTGTELAWWITPDHRGSGTGVRLLRFMERLAKGEGIKYWNMVSMQTSMPGEVNKMYEKMGYTLQESVYTKVI
jgi:GNAT superfamily N-acetyltransferase